MNIINKKIELSDGRVIEIETGKLAKQADGSAVIKMGGTMLLATVTCAKEVKEGTDFMPLQVDYKEKFYAAGRFPGGFMKREGKASDYEILISRLVDRALRPLSRMISILRFMSMSTLSLQTPTLSRMHSQDLLHQLHSQPATFRSEALSLRFA